MTVGIAANRHAKERNLAVAMRDVTPKDSGLALGLVITPRQLGGALRLAALTCVDLPGMESRLPSESEITSLLPSRHT